MIPFIGHPEWSFVEYLPINTLVNLCNAFLISGNAGSQVVTKLYFLLFSFGLVLIFNVSFLFILATLTNCLSTISESYPECNKYALYLIKLSTKNWSCSILSEQFLLTLSATEYGLFFATWGGCDDKRLRYSCESIGFEWISEIRYPPLKWTLTSRKSKCFSLYSGSNLIFPGIYIYLEGRSSWPISL